MLAFTCMYIKVKAKKKIPKKNKKKKNYYSNNYFNAKNGTNKF